MKKLFFIVLGLVIISYPLGAGAGDIVVEAGNTAKTKKEKTVQSVICKRNPSLRELMPPTAKSVKIHIGLRWQSGSFIDSYSTVVSITLSNDGKRARIKSHTTSQILMCEVASPKKAKKKKKKSKRKK